MKNSEKSDILAFLENPKNSPKFKAYFDLKTDNFKKSSKIKLSKKSSKIDYFRQKRAFRNRAYFDHPLSKFNEKK